MASVFTHGFVGVALGGIFSHSVMPRRFWISAALCAILPDADAFGYALGVEYGSFLGHRGFTHSLAFAAIVGVVVTMIGFREVPRRSRAWWGLVLFFFLATASHSLLDAMTTGGLGVALFSPFDTGRYFLPWRPIRVSPIGVGSFFSEWGVRVIISECIWVWLPLLPVVGVAWFVRRRDRSFRSDA